MLSIKEVTVSFPGGGSGGGVNLTFFGLLRSLCCQIPFTSITVIYSEWCHLITLQHNLFFSARGDSRESLLSTLSLGCPITFVASSNQSTILCQWKGEQST